MFRGFEKYDIVNLYARICQDVRQNLLASREVFALDKNSGDILGAAFAYQHAAPVLPIFAPIQSADKVVQNAAPQGYRFCH